MSLDQDDNIIVGAGTGGSTQGAEIATDFIPTDDPNGKHYQIFKQGFGQGGSVTLVGDGSTPNSKPLPTKLFQDNGTALSAETLTAGLSVLNVNLRGTSGSGNVPVDINAQTLGVVRVEGKTGGTPMGVCGDNFQIRTLFGATTGNTLTSIFSHGGDYDSVSVQGISGAFPVGITATNLHIRPLTSTDQVTVAGTVTVSPGAGFSLDGGTLAIRGGVTGYGHAQLTTSPEGGVPVLLYGNSGGTAAGIGMSGDTLKVSLGQTISADIGDITIDGSAPKASDFDVTGRLNLGSQDGTTVGTPVLLYGMSGGHGVTTTAVALAVTGGGALLTEIQGSISASVGDISVDVPKAVGYTHGGGIATTGNKNLNLSDGDVTGNTMATPVLLYGASGNTAVGLGITQTVAGAAGEQALLVAGDMKVHNSVALSVTGADGPLDVKVASLPNVTIGTFTPTVTVQHAGIGVTIAGGTLAVDNVVQVQGVGFTLSGGSIDSAAVVGGVTGFGTGGFAGGPASIANAPGNTNGLPVFLYGNSGGTAGAVGMFGEGIKVHHEEGITVGNVTGNVSVFGGVTGMGSSLDVGPGPLGGDGITVSGGLPVLLYGRSGGSQTPVSVGMSGDGIKVSVIDGVNLTVTGTEVNISDIKVENKEDTRLAVGLSGDTLVPAGATFHDGTALNVNTHFFGLTGGLHNSFGLTAGGTYGSSIMVTGFSGPGTAVQTEDKSLVDHMGGFTNDILRALYTNAAIPNDFDPSDPGVSVFDKAAGIESGVTTLTGLVVPLVGASTNISNNTGNFVTDLRSLITGLDEADFNNQTVNDVNQSILRVDVNGIKLPDAAVDDQTFGNTAGVLPDIGTGNQENAVNLPAHLLTKGVNIKNTSGTGIIHIGFSEGSVDGPSPIGGYELHSREEVFIETNNLNNLWVSSCPGASGCYIGG